MFSPGTFVYVIWVSEPTKEVSIEMGPIHSVWPISREYVVNLSVSGRTKVGSGYCYTKFEDALAEAERVGLRG